MMNVSTRKSLARRWGLAAALTIGFGSAALAFGINPAGWKFADGGKAVRWRPATIQFAIVKNDGPDTIDVTAVGKTMIAEGEILPGDNATVVMPKGSKKLKLVDDLGGNGLGANGTLIWTNKLNAQGQVIDVKPKQ